MWVLVHPIHRLSSARKPCFDASTLYINVKKKKKSYKHIPAFYHLVQFKTIFKWLNRTSTFKGNISDDPK